MNESRVLTQPGPRIAAGHGWLADPDDLTESSQVSASPEDRLTASSTEVRDAVSNPLIEFALPNDEAPAPAGNVGADRVFR